MMVKLESGDYVNSQHISHLFIEKGDFHGRVHGYQVWIYLVNDGSIPLGRRYKTRDDAQKAMDDFVDTVFEGDVKNVVARAAAAD